MFISKCYRRCAFFVASLSFRLGVLRCRVDSGGTRPFLNFTISRVAYWLDFIVAFVCVSMAGGAGEARTWNDNRAGAMDGMDVG